MSNVCRVPTLRKFYHPVFVITAIINTNVTITTTISWDTSKWNATETPPWS